MAPTYEFTKSLFEHGLPLSKQHFEAIGLVAAASQVLEAAVQIAIWSIVGLDGEQGKLLTASMRFDSLLDVLTVLAPTAKQSAEQPIDISILIAETKTLQGERNTVVHALWDFSGDLLAPVAKKLKLKAPKDSPKYTPEQINDIATRITAVRMRWIDLVDIQLSLRQKSAPQNPPEESAE